MCILERILICDIMWVTRGNNFTVFNENCLIAILLDGIHAMCDKYNCLAWIGFDLLKEPIALLLESLVSNRKYFI